jgi:hypothetical protein
VSCILFCSRLSSFILASSNSILRRLASKVLCVDLSTSVV